MQIELSKGELRLIQEVLDKERRRLAVHAHMYETGAFTETFYRHASEKRKMILELLERWKVIK